MQSRLCCPMWLPDKARFDSMKTSFLFQLTFLATACSSQQADPYSMSLDAELKKKTLHSRSIHATVSNKKSSGAVVTYMQSVMKTIFALLLLVLIVNDIHANTCDRDDLELIDYGSLPNASMARLSPDGKSVVFREGGRGPGSVSAYSLKRGNPIASASLDQTKLVGLDFVGNNSIVFRAEERTRVSGYKGQIDLGTAFLLQGYNLRQLIVPGQRLAGGVRVHPAQSGMGQIVGINQTNNAIFAPAYINKDGQTTLALLEISLNENKLPKVIETGFPDTVDYLVNDKGVAIVQERYNERSNRHRILVKKNSEWQAIYENTVEMVNFEIQGITHDYDEIIIKANTVDSNYSSLFYISTENGQIYALDVGNDKKDVDHVYTDLNGLVYGYSFAGFKPSYKMYSELLQKRVEEIVSKFPTDSVNLVDWSSDWETILVQVSGPTSAGDYYVARAGEEPRLAIRGRPKFKNTDLHPVVAIEVAARDNLKIPALLTSHNTYKEVKNMPTVVLPHGGPASHDSIEFNYVAQVLANQGYLVVQPQFRGSTGFGKAFEDAGNGAWGSKSLDDITDVVTHLVGEGYTNSERVCIVGASYGGYAALLSSARYPQLYKCVVSIGGITDILEMIEYDKEKFGKTSQQVRYLEQAIGGGEFRKDELISISPLRKVMDIQAPVLLIHGENDDVVPVIQSKKMVSALKKKKNDVKLVVLKDGDHYLSDSEARIEALKELVGFINKKIGTEEQFGPKTWMKVVSIQPEHHTRLKRDTIIVAELEYAVEENDVNRLFIYPMIQDQNPRTSSTGNFPLETYGLTEKQGRKLVEISAHYVLDVKYPKRPYEIQFAIGCKKKENYFRFITSTEKQYYK